MYPSVDKAQQINAVATWLELHQELWKTRPFVDLPACWEKDYPAVSRALRDLSEEALEAYEPEPWTLPDMPADFRQWTEQSRALSARPSLWQSATLPTARRPKDIKERKWEQVRHFAAVALGQAPEGGRWLDWCSGKGHLGRTLAGESGRPVTCVEKQRHLCQSGAKLALSQGVDATFACADVLDLPEGVVTSRTLAVALHACGDLHRKLIAEAVGATAPFVALSPCCYHRMEGDLLPRLSTAGKAAPLSPLHRHHVRLIGLSEKVSGRRRKRLRRREQAFRLGLDLLLRETTGQDVYRPMGPVARSWLQSSFEDFCRRLADRAGLDLPDRWDAAAYERAGEERFKTTRALGLVRALFRDPLETFLLLDRALYLEEQGYSVVVGSFCPPLLTPRNAILLATAKG